MLDRLGEGTNKSRPAYQGQPVLRREDDRLITGRGCFVGDVPLENPLHLAFARSPVAIGRLALGNLDEIQELEGVTTAFEGRHVSDLGSLSVSTVLEKVGFVPFPILAEDMVQFVGQPIAAILAETPDAALDAIEAYYAEIETDGFEPILAPNGSKKDQDVIYSGHWQDGDISSAFDRADHVVEVEISHSRLAPSPMENRAIAVEYLPATDSVKIWLSTQTPHRARSELSEILDRPAEQIHVIAPDVGGAFGMKASLYPEEIMAVWSAFDLQRSVRWTSTRNEDLLSASHGRGIHSAAKLAFSSDGKFEGLIAEATAPLGAWLTTSSAIPGWNAARILPGPYDIPNYDIQTKGQLTNTAPVGIYRGAGRPEAAMLMERLVEKAAQQLGLDPGKLREKNLLTPDQLGQRRQTGVLLDSGNYPEGLKSLLSAADYKVAKARQAERRAQGEYVGLGISFFVEPSGTGWESARVCLNPDGSVDVYTGGSTQGHGRETAYAQIVGDVFSCDLDKITVTAGNTEVCPAGIGALASRSTAIGGSAVLKAAQEVLQKMGGRSHPQEPVEATVIYDCEGEAWGYGCYFTQLTIDPPTGEMSIEKIVCVDDAGTVINPMFVEGQIFGGLVQGLGEATLEQIVYNEEGQLVTGSLMDYGLPRASDIPGITLEQRHTQSPQNPLGSKGVGEAGTIGLPPAILNAALDALAPLGVTDLTMPLTSNNIWQAIQDAQQSGKQK
ncbi:MAG: xanthine dehydrogenase family protein molybdopterin-binding subunit [Proteobacteria bacterium]|nr:xanthine dehydrogenase family protein molybdopterin-binding subunit [Pseudomonadota bacterium]